jgi:Yip1 domain
MDIVGRVKGLLLDPKAEWQVIAGEQTSPGDLIKNYVAILAAIPAVCGFIGASIIGVGGIRTPFLSGIVSAIIGYVLTIIGVFVVAWLVNFLADKFGGQNSFPNAMKVAAYSPTAAWVASVFTALPILAVLMVLGLYSFYLLYLGLPILMRAPPEKALGYLLSVIVCAIIVWVLIFSLPLMLFGLRMM